MEARSSYTRAAEKQETQMTMTGDHQGFAIPARLSREEHSKRLWDWSQTSRIEINPGCKSGTLLHSYKSVVKVILESVAAHHFHFACGKVESVFLG